MDIDLDEIEHRESGRATERRPSSTRRTPPMTEDWIKAKAREIWLSPVSHVSEVESALLEAQRRGREEMRERAIESLDGLAEHGGCDVGSFIVRGDAKAAIRALAIGDGHE